jgi:hypothetical protein
MALKEKWTMESNKGNTLAGGEGKVAPVPGTGCTDYPVLF